MTKVVVDAPLEDLPDLMTRAVHSVSGASLIEVGADGALVARRTNFALASESTRFSFHDLLDGKSEVRAESTNGGALGFVAYKDVVGEVGRGLLNALVRLAAESA